MVNKLFKSMFAFAMVAALAVGFVACETDEPEVSTPTVELSTKSLTFSNAEGTKSVEVTANAGWVVDAGDADWITVTPQSGNGNGVISVSVPMNDTGVLRQATIKVSSVHPEWGPGWDTKRITVSQSADQNTAVEVEDLYYDNFDGEEATKTYGSEGTSYPFIDEFPQFANATGEAAANVTYSGSGASVRATTPSNGSYSEYAGSGVNNIFFGRSAFFQINGIALESNQNNLTLSFGGVKYAQDGDSKFSTDEFKVYVSKNGKAWVELEYTYAGTTDGKWNVATADFTLTEVPSALYVKFTASVASVYRIDDAKLATGNGGQQITLPTEAVLPDMEEVTVAEFLEAAEDATLYKLTGEITRVANEVYGNFDITDATGTVYVYGLLTPDGVDKTQWAAAGLKKGDTITIYGPRSSYNGSPQMTNATYISHVPGEGGGEEPTPEPAEGPYASDAPFVCSADDTTNAAYTLKGTTIDGSAVTGVKLGKGKQAGRFTSAAIGVSGDKYLNFYAAAWNGSSNISLYYRIDGGATQSQPLAANTTVAGTIPFTSLKFADSDHYSVKLTGLTENSTIEFSSDPNFELTAYDSNAPRLVVCGVKLTDEPIVVEPTPEPTPGEKATIAEVLALGQDASISAVIEGYVISNMDLNNLTSKKGMYVQDETGGLQLRFNADHSFAYGSKVEIDLTGCTLGEYSGAVQVSGVANDKVTVLSTGNTIAAKTVSMADFLANKYEGQYIALDGVQVVAADLAKTWSTSDNHTSINMEDANGNNFIVFSSKYATYGAETVAQGSGTIKGISSINNGNMQIIFAQASDYAGLTGERFTASENPTPDPEPEPEPEPTPGDVKKVTIAEFLAAAEDDTVYELTGVITSVANTNYGNFYLKDDTAEVYIYGLCSPSGAEKYWAESGLKVGDTVTLRTVRTSHNGTPQGKNAIYVSHIAGEAPEIDPDGKFASQSIFTSTVDENKKVYLQSATINGENCEVIKFGTSSVIGTLTSAPVNVTGDKTLSLYGVAWNGKSGKIAISVDGNEVTTIELTSNAGAANNAPYTITLDETTDFYSVNLTGLTATSTITISTVSGATRVILAGVSLE